MTAIVTLFVTACAQIPASEKAGGPAVVGLDGESAARAAGISDVIFVVPPQGATSQTGLVLADAIAAGLRDRNHPAILAFQPNQAGASIVAEVVSAEPHGDVVWLSMDWHVRAPYGTHVATYRQHVVIDDAMWQTGSPEAINLLVDDAAPRVLDMVENHVGPPMIGAMRREGPEMTVAEPDIAETPPDTVMTAAPPGADAPPAISSAPQVPIARISERTNGQVLMPEREALTPPAPLTPPTETVALDPPPAEPSAEPLAEAAVASPVDLASSPPPVSASGRPPLPSLLDLPPPDQPAATGAPSDMLVSGAAATVAPPPGGVSVSDTEDGLLDRLSPNMASDARRPGDARPDVENQGSFARVRWGQPAFLIRPVAGAPGNGNEALTAALKSALRDRDLTISEDPRQAGFVIDGDVDMGPPASGRQYVRITWRVTTVTGDEVGRAVQENTVIAGSLDGEWGQVAEAVSNAAVRGIKDLFDDAGKELSTRGALPDFPSVSLPTVPGRAPPPPATF